MASVNIATVNMDAQVFLWDVVDPLGIPQSSKAGTRSCDGLGDTKLIFTVAALICTPVGYKSSISSPPLEHFVCWFCFCSLFPQTRSYYVTLAGLELAL